MQPSPHSKSTCTESRPLGTLRLYIELLSGPMDGLEFQFDQPTVIIGRAETSDLSLPLDLMVSRIHARIIQEQGAVWVEDAQSLNGTFLEDKQLKSKTQALPGAIFRVGMTDLRIKF